MKRLLIYIPSLIRADIVCPLLPSRGDELLTLPLLQGKKRLNLIADTGSGETLLFSKSDSEEYTDGTAFEYQHMTVGLINPHMRLHGVLDCSDPIHISDELKASVGSHNDITDVADGIIGLGRKQLGESSGNFIPFLFSNSAPRWTEIMISVPAPLTVPGQLVFKTSESSLTGSRRILPEYMRVISKYYWAVNAERFRMGNEVIGHDIAVIFDTGSNFFGVSGNLMRVIRDDIAIRGCTDSMTFEITSSTGLTLFLSFTADQFSFDIHCKDLAMSAIDPSRFGDLSRRNVVIVGTRGLSGRTFTIHKLASDNDSVYLSVK